MWHNSYSPYVSGERFSPGIDDEEMVDVSEIARRQGIRYPVLLTPALAGALKPNRILSTFGIRFDKRVGNVLKVLRTQMNNPRHPRYYGDDDDDEEARENCSFPFVVLQGPNIEEKLISIRALVRQDEEGEPVVMLDSSRAEAA
jgi:hypothetical protein